MTVSANASNTLKTLALIAEKLLAAGLENPTVTTSMNEAIEMAVPAIFRGAVDLVLRDVEGALDKALTKMVAASEK